MEKLNVIASRKSVRYFLGTWVDQSKWDLVLEAARVAPFWTNKQCWSLIIVKDPVKVKMLVGK